MNPEFKQQIHLSISFCVDCEKNGFHGLTAVRKTLLGKAKRKKRAGGNVMVVGIQHFS